MEILLALFSLKHWVTSSALGCVCMGALVRCLAGGGARRRGATQAQDIRVLDSIACLRIADDALCA